MLRKGGKILCTLRHGLELARVRLALVTQYPYPLCVCACLLLTLDETVALHNVMTRRRVSDQRMASHPVRGSREEMFLSVKYVPGV